MYAWFYFINNWVVEKVIPDKISFTKMEMKILQKIVRYHDVIFSTRFDRIKKDSNLWLFAFLNSHNFQAFWRKTVRKKQTTVIIPINSQNCCIYSFYRFFPFFWRNLNPASLFRQPNSIFKWLFLIEFR
jgi:hypothetical protein